MRRLIPLLLAMLLLMSGCTDVARESAPAQAPKEIIELRVLTMGTEPVRGVEEFYARLDALTMRDFDCIVRFAYVPWGDEKNTINNAIAAGEYDLYCNGVFTDYRSLSQRNAFVNLNTYLHLVPDLVARYADISPNALTQCEIDGGLFGFPQVQNETTSRDGIFFYRDDLCDEWNIPRVTSFDTMEDYLYAAKEDARFSDYPMIVDNRVWQCLFEMLGGSSYLEITTLEDMRYAVVSLDSPYEVICRMETPIFYTILEHVQRWYRDGIIDPKILGLTDNEGSQALAMLLNGQKPCETNSTSSAVTKYYVLPLYEKNPEWRWNLFYNSQNAPLYRKSLADATCLSVSNRCLYPELAVRLIEKAHVDREYFDLLAYGVEGINYHLADGRISYEGISAEHRWQGWTGLVDIYMDYSVYAGEMPWYQTLEAYEDDIQWRQNFVGDSPLIDLNMNMGSYDTAALDEAWDLYMKPLLCGISDDLAGDYAVAMEAMYEAGLQAYLDEVQTQLTEYAQAKANQE